MRIVKKERERERSSDFCADGSPVLWGLDGVEELAEIIGEEERLHCGEELVGG